MRTVHKFGIPHIGKSFVLPADQTFKPLTMQMQHGKLQLWAEVESYEPQELRYLFIVVGTGHAIPHGFRWIDTVQDGAFVWHLYGAVQ